jgi:hypothetical protein
MKGKRIKVNVIRHTCRILKMNLVVIHTTVLIEKSALRGTYVILSINKGSCPFICCQTDSESDKLISVWQLIIFGLQCFYLEFKQK